MTFDFIFPYTALVTIAALWMYLTLVFLVGRGRGKYGVPAPSTSGPDEWLRRYRVQMNTLEQMIFFLPALWLAALTQGDTLAAILGAVWILARLLYAKGYYEAANKRTLGFLLSLVAANLLVIASLIKLLPVVL